MGQVYKAEDPALGRPVALKFLRWNDPVQLERFLREARSQARVEHPHVCKVYETGWVEDRPYIAMQYVDGGTLSASADLLSLEQKAQVVGDVAEAVHEAHRGGLIHRDLKPGNILLERSEDGRWHPYVVDFGLAHDEEAHGLTRTGAVTGTPDYLSPEQAQGRPVDRRSDVYSLGVVLYELLAGEVPLAGGSFAASLVRVVSEDPPPLSRRAPRVPRDLGAVVMKCLEKEPQRRYESARALALDLRRFLDGEPVLARSPSLAYRAGKWIARHRAAAAILAVSTSLLAALLAYGLRLQWGEARRAELLQRFTQEVAGVESEMRLAALLPRHDARAHKAALLARMETIRGEMRGLGEVAEGPGHYALGRGHLALHDHEAALEHLERAWRLGYRRPEVGQALGRALGALYQKALLTREPAEEAAEPRPPGATEAGQEAIDRRFRLPALAYLRQGEAPRGPYAEAMAAFFDRRYEEALAKAREASAAEPWFYEARQLEAEVYLDQAMAAVRRGRMDEGLELFRRAGEVYEELLALARSDAAVYAAECRRRAEVAAVLADLHRFSPEEAAGALARCDEALSVDPDLAEAYAQKAFVLATWGGQVGRSGGDPRPLLAEARRMAEAAVARNRHEVLAHRHLGSALLSLALWVSRRGEDPGPYFEQAAASLEEALAIQPALPESHQTLGNVRLRQAEWEAAGGGDPRPTLARAVASYRAGLDLDPSRAGAWNTLGYASLVRAEHEIERGLDPRAALGEAAAFVRRAIDLNPDNPRWHNQLGTVALTEGDHLLRSGGDPRAAFDLAAASFETALRLNPAYDFAHYNLAFARRGLAQYLLEQGRDPSLAVAAVRASVARALAADGGDFEARLELARAERLAGEWEAAQGRSPAAGFRAAGEALAEGLAVNPRSPELLREEALLARSLARAPGTGEGRRARALQQALAAVERCLAAAPEDAAALALKADLLWSAAPRIPGGPRPAAAREARRLLDEAFRRSPLLERPYGPLAAELEAALAAGPAR